MTPDIKCQFPATKRALAKRHLVPEQAAEVTKAEQLGCQLVRQSLKSRLRKARKPPKSEPAVVVEQKRLDVPGGCVKTRIPEFASSALLEEL